tara:strand:+ start:19124 stop:20887 length:1764 start_codon:yes stop_codon:yes gene_type:complete
MSKEPVLKTFFASLIGGFVALFSFFVICAAIIIMALPKSPPAPDSVVLELDLRGEMSDQPASSGPPIFATPAFINVIQDLYAAADDDNVHGVFIRANDFSFGHSRAEELRDAILHLREAGKFVYVHSQGFMGVSPSAYRSIAAADEIYLQPGSEIVVSGISTETMFMGELFENLSISAEIEQFYEYKNSPNVYQQTDYTDPHREAMTELISDIWEVTLADIAEDRGFDDVEQLRTLLESGPIPAEAALEANLVTQLNWPEDASEAVLERAGHNAELLPISSYTPPEPGASAPAIAIVGGEGTIITGGGSTSPFSDEGTFASDAISEALLSAGRNPNVEAIVFRVDSGGGSAIASEQIWRAVDRIQNEMNKPVVVSMGSLAASGGYYVAAGADAIFASETTITGSIGVFGGKFAIADGLRRLGINPSTLAVGGELAGAYSTESFTETQRSLMHDALERTYDRFMQIVSNGRNIDEARVREIARGRVWSGTDALELNLVTDIGGLMDAIERAAQLADIAEDEDFRTIYYPQPMTLDEFIGEMFGASADTAEAAAHLNTLMSDERVQILMEHAAALDAQGIQARSEFRVH